MQDQRTLFHSMLHKSESYDDLLDRVTACQLKEDFGDDADKIDDHTYYTYRAFAQGFLPYYDRLINENIFHPSSEFRREGPAKPRGQRHRGIFPNVFDNLVNIDRVKVKTHTVVRYSFLFCSPFLEFYIFWQSGFRAGCPLFTSLPPASSSLLPLCLTRIIESFLFSHQILS